MKPVISSLEPLRRDDPVDQMMMLTCTSCRVQLYLPARTVHAKTWTCPACHAVTKTER